MGAVIAGVPGRTVRVEEIDADTYLEGLFGGRDKSLIRHETSVARSLQSRYRAHDFVGNPNVLTWLLGRAPTTFEQFVSTLHASLASDESERISVLPPTVARSVAETRTDARTMRLTQ